MAEKGIEPLIIYLDQNAWIELAKIYFNKTTSDDGKVLLEKIRKAVDENRAIFPITITNYDEALRVSYKARRKKLAYYIFRISQGYSFHPNISRTIEAELCNVILRKVGLPTIKMRKYILKQGTSNLMGAKYTLTQSFKSPLPKEIIDQLYTLTETSFSLNFILNEAETVKCDVKQSDIDKMEKNRHELFKIKDKKLRYKTFMAWNIHDFLVPIIAEFLYYSGLPKDTIIRAGMTEDDIYRLLDSLPTALCFLTLLYQRDQLADRKIEANDFNDIVFLSLSIPYSDIVVTEKLWKTISHGSKLDVKCNTRVFSSVYELLPFL